MASHFADVLLDRAAKLGAPICVGIDPVLDKLPADILRQSGIDPTSAESIRETADESKAASSLLAYGRAVIDAVADIAPAIKVNIAFFERYHVEGVRAYYELVRIGRDAGLSVIGDVKRADIGHSAEAYSDAQLSDPITHGLNAHSIPDAITINPYFGLDGVKPFLDASRRTGKGVFVLVQTSNESANEIQNVKLEDGTLVSERVAKLVHGWSTGTDLVGSSGYSCVGAVVSPRDLTTTDKLRKLMPSCLFLVPGFGAQGRTPDEVMRCFKNDGTGALITASRSVGFAFADARYQNQFGIDWKRCIHEACRDFRQAIQNGLASAR